MVKFTRPGEEVCLGHVSHGKYNKNYLDKQAICYNFLNQLFLTCTVGPKPKRHLKINLRGQKIIIRILKAKLLHKMMCIFEILKCRPCLGGSSGATGYTVGDSHTITAITRDFAAS